MKHNHLKFLLLLISLFVLTGCRSESVDATKSIVSEFEQRLDETEISNTQVPTDAPPTLVPSPTPTQMAVYQRSKACLECHTDKQALIDTAKPEVQVEPENEGVG